MLSLRVALLGSHSRAMVSDRMGQWCVVLVLLSTLSFKVDSYLSDASPAATVPGCWPPVVGSTLPLERADSSHEPWSLLRSQYSYGVPSYLLSGQIICGNDRVVIEQELEDGWMLRVRKKEIPGVKPSGDVGSGIHGISRESTSARAQG